MFLTKNNQVKWKKIGVGAIVTLGLVVLGVMWYDRTLYLFMREFDCGFWGWLDRFFSFKMWLMGSAVVLGAFWIKKVLKTKIEFKNKQGKFSPIAMVRDFYNKTKGSYAFYVFCSVAVAGVITGILKFVLGRARPIFFEGLGMTGFFPFTAEWAFNSMPSGHTAATFAGLVMIGLLVPRYKVFTWTGAIVVGASRVMVGAHWPTDVILGAFIGMVVADVVKWAVAKIK